MKQEASIGLFNDSYPPVMDGVTLTVQNYVYWLRRMSENVSVITPGYFGQKDREPYPIYRYASLPIRSRYPYRYGIPEIDFRIYYRLGRIPFSLVHAHCPFSSGRLAVMLPVSNIYLLLPLFIPNISRISPILFPAGLWSIIW